LNGELMSDQNHAAALDALGDAILQVDCYDVVEGDEVPRSDFWAVVAAARKVLSAHPIEPPQHGCDAHDRRPCYTCAAHPAEPAPVGHSWSPNGVHYPPLGGAHVVERCQSGCPPQPEPAPVVTDEARAVRNRAVDVIQDNLDGPAYDGGPSRINVAKIVRALSDAGLLSPRPLLDREAALQAIVAVSVPEGSDCILGREYVENYADVFADAVLELARPMPAKEQIEAAVRKTICAHFGTFTGAVKVITDDVVALLSGAES
jgi:hypothetical protein